MKVRRTVVVSSAILPSPNVDSQVRRDSAFTESCLQDVLYKNVNFDPSSQELTRSSI
jgi:hypothetical protein